MKNLIIILLATSLILAITTCPNQYCTTCDACSCCGSTLFLPRPQGSNTAYFFNPYYWDCSNCSAIPCSAYIFGFRFNQTFDGKNIAKCLLGSDILTFVGFGNYNQSVNQTVAKNAQFVRADDFGLSPFYKGTIRFNPRIRNFNIDFAGRWELGDQCDCLTNFYIGVNTTLAHTCWNWRHTCSKAETSYILLNPENVTLAIDIMFPLGEMSEYRNFDGFKSIPEALQAERGFGGDGFSTYGVLGPMQYGRFVLDHAAEATALANLDAILGYDFFRHDNSHFGLFIRISAPTGTKIKSLTIFEPIVGNGHHWEFGGGIDAHWELWNCNHACLISYLNGNLTHLFNDGQRRIIPLLSGCCLSQYTLLKEYGQNEMLLPGLVRGTDVAARHVKSSFAIQTDATLGFIFRDYSWAFGTGFNLFARSHEKLKDVTPTCDLDKRLFGIKGRTPVFAPIPDEVGWYIASTTSKYCITDPNNVNTPIDGIPTSLANSTDWYTGTTAYTADPTYINLYPIPEMNGVPRMITYKLFGTIDYQWEECTCNPFLGIGGEAEFASNRKCNVCTANQWGIWMRGGMIF